MNKKWFSIILTILAVLVAMTFVSFQARPAYAETAATPTLTQAASPSPTPVPTQYRWDLAAIYTDEKAWQKEFDTVSKADLPIYKKYVGKLGSADTLLEFLKFDETTQRTSEKLYVYAWMKSDEDQTNSAASERASVADSLTADLGSARAFVNPELVALPDATIQGYLKDSRFAQYKQMFDAILKKKSHTLPKEQEELLAAASEMSASPDKIASKIRDADMKFPTIKNPKGEDVALSEAVYGDVLSNENRDFRKTGFEGIMKGYDGSKFSLATALDGQMRVDAFYATARKYDSALQASLDGNNIPQAVYDNLLKATDKNLKTLHDYVSLRKKVLGVDNIHYYDMYNPLVSSYDVSFPYEQAKQVIATALQPLGKDYLDNLAKGFDSKWIDVYPSKGKTSGAYSWGSYDTHPYVLSNYTDAGVDGMLTIAHEMGHALNSLYTNKNQPYIYSNVSTFNAEIASTTNEMLVLRYLLDNAKDDPARLYYLNQIAESIRGTFFAQVMYAEFEKAIHERVEKGEALSVDSLNEMWKATVVKYYGDDFLMDDAGQLVWARIPHFYYNFYVYQYATGIAASNQFVKNIKDNKPGAADKYLAFLKAGSSGYPVDLLKASGVDMTSNAPVDNLLADFSDTINKMEELLKKEGKIK